MVAIPPMTAARMACHPSKASDGQKRLVERFAHQGNLGHGHLLGQQGSYGEQHVALIADRPGVSLKAAVGSVMASQAGETLPMLMFG